MPVPLPATSSTRVLKPRFLSQTVSYDMASGEQYPPRPTAETPLPAVPRLAPVEQRVQKYLVFLLRVLPDSLAGHRKLRARVPQFEIDSETYKQFITLASAETVRYVEAWCAHNLMRISYPHRALLTSKYVY